MKQLVLAAIAASALLAPVEVSACSPSDFTLKQLDWHREGSDYVRIIGELINNCREPAGVQLQLVFRDANGKVVAVDEPWPASTRNIAGGASYPFSLIDHYSAGATNLEAHMIDAKTW